MQSLQLRNAVAGLSADAGHDLASLWRHLESAAQAQEALHDILPALVDQYGSAAAALGAQWYDDLRVKAGVSGTFAAAPAEIAETGTHALVGWALAEATDFEAFQGLILGGTTRRISNFARETTTQAAIADPRAAGWQRVGAGECAFCAMLIGRGAVYSEAGADFASHDHCACMAQPAFDGAAKPVKPYAPSGRDITDADRSRVREYLRTH